MGKIGFNEVMIVTAIVLLLFGSSRIPKLMRSIGAGLSEFKKGLKGGSLPEAPVQHDDK